MARPTSDDNATALLAMSEGRARKVTGGNPQTPQYWLQKLFGGGVENLSGVRVTEDTALRFSPFWSGVTLIASGIGALPIALVRKTEEGRKEITDHPGLRLLHTRPNPFTSPMAFKETLQAHAITWGNGYAWIERSPNGDPVNLWQLPPNTVRPEIKELAGDDVLMYRVQAKGKEVFYLWEDVLHIKGIGFDGLIGYNLVQYATESLGAGIAAEQHAASFFGNSALPQIVLEHPTTIGDEAQERLRTSWQKTYGGVANANKTAIIEEGMKLNKVTVDPQVSQLLETREFSPKEVGRWLRIPPYMLGASDQGKATTEAQGREFVTWTLMPWLTRWEEESSYKLLRTTEKADHSFKVRTAALLRGDLLTRYNAYRTGRQWGWLSIDDVRRLEDMTPIGEENGGTVYLVPMNMGDASDPATFGSTASDSQDGNTQGEGQDDEPRMLQAHRQLLEAAMARIVTKQVRAFRKAAKNPDRFGEWADKFYAELPAYFREVIGPVVEAAASAMGRAAPDITELSERLSKETHDLLTTFGMDAAERHIVQLNAQGAEHWAETIMLLIQGDES